MASHHLFLLLLVLTLNWTAIGAFKTAYQNTRDFEFEQFKLHFNRSYASPIEEARRREIFTMNLRKIEQHNSANLSYTLGVNQFTDLTPAEFTARFAVSRLSPFHSVLNESTDFFEETAMASLPKTVDWVAKGVVTSVKNQNDCSCCYAMAAAGAIEGQVARRYGKGRMKSLSVQQIVDCSGAEGNLGCNGGDMALSFKYIYKNGGIAADKDYPFVGKQQPCRFKAKLAKAKLSGWHFVAPNERTLQEEVAKIGPIAVAIFPPDDFQHYRRGVYNSKKCRSSARVGHAVLVVGYGVTKKGQPFWKVKNSWGRRWGSKGYGRIARNAGNLCGIASHAVYPVLK